MDDSLAQLVEHNTFNVGVLGSSPKRITKESSDYLRQIVAFFVFICNHSKWDHLQNVTIRKRG